jgi:hypothetical protein
MASRLTNEEYDKKLAKFGKACRLEPYVNQHTRILHRCLIHGEEWLAIPGDLALGHGMKCCGKVLNNDAKAAYDSKLAAIGLAERVDPYISRRAAIRHRCLRHGKLFSQEPRRALEGRIPPCCGGMWRGSLYAMLMEPTRWGLNSYSIVYLFRLARFPGYVKIGISSNIKLRADEEYGDFVCYWNTQSRFHAFLVEQASLRDVSLESACPLELADNKWAGNTEVRKTDSNQAIQIIQFYFDALDKLGPYQFILDYLSPNEMERNLCEKALAEIDQA